MPWVKRTRTHNRIYWIAAGMGSIVLGVLTGYVIWGQTASMVINVEHELSRSDALVKSLEKRVQALEAKLAAEDGAVVPSASVRAH